MVVDPQIKGIAEASGPPRCPICDGVSWSEQYSGLRDRQFDLPGRFDVWVCDTCGVWRLWPIPDDLDRYYPEEYGPHSTDPKHWNTGLRGLLGSKLLFSRHRYLRGAARRWMRPNEAAIEMRTYLDSLPASVFDYGCGSGRFLAFASQLGLRTAGVDLSQRAVARAQAAKINCRLGSYESLGESNERFELVRSWHVLEHIDNPVAGLKALAGLTADGGRMAIAVPNTASALAALFGADWFQLDLPRHVWGFNPHNMRLAFERAGIRLEKIVYNGSGPAVFHSMLYALERVAPELQTPLDGRASLGMNEVARVWNEIDAGDSMVAVGVRNG